MNPSLYVDRASALHRMNPVVKLLCLFALFALALVVLHPAALAVLWAFGLLCGLPAGVLQSVRRVWKLMAVLFIFTIVIWLIFYRPPPGQTLHMIAGLGYRGTAGARPVDDPGSWRVVLYREPLLFSLGMAMRLTLLLFFGLIFLASTKIEDMTAGLTRLGVPYVASFSLALAFRLVPLFMASAYTVVQAQRSRGLDFRRGRFAQRLRKYLAVVVPIFMQALRRSGDLAMALESKGFGAGPRRTSLRAYPFRFRDILAAAAVLLLGALTFWLRKKGLGGI